MVRIEIVGTHSKARMPPMPASEAKNLITPCRICRRQNEKYDLIFKKGRGGAVPNNVHQDIDDAQARLANY